MLQVSAGCNRCGACVDSCPSGLLAMNGEGPQYVGLEEACIACGHCVAACPEAALDHRKAPLRNQVPLDRFPVLDAPSAYRFLRSRRSIRRYKPDAVPKEILLQLLDLARFAPSGGNTQGLSYIVVTQPELMKKLTAVTVNWLEDLLAKTDAPWIKRYARIVDSYRATRYDTVLRDAPSLIVATAPKAAPMGKDTARFALAYAELFATTLGLGTCWAGLFEGCASSGSHEVQELLGIDEQTAVVGAIMVGYPRYTYHRLVDRNPLAVAWR